MPKQNQFYVSDLSFKKETQLHDSSRISLDSTLKAQLSELILVDMSCAKIKIRSYELLNYKL